MRSLPNRQLRNRRALYNSTWSGSLPNRQLRKRTGSSVVLDWCSLPNRQLRNRKITSLRKLISSLPNRQLRKKLDKPVGKHTGSLPNRQLRNEKVRFQIQYRGSLPNRQLIKFVGKYTLACLCSRFLRSLFYLRFSTPTYPASPNTCFSSSCKRLAVMATSCLLTAYFPRYESYP